MEGIDNIIQKAEHLNQIMQGMQEGLDKVGFPGKIKNFLKAARNKCAKLLNWMFNWDIKMKKVVAKHEVQEIVTITRQFDLKKMKQDVDKMEIPKYGKKAGPT